jgi:DNA-binding response OmpR family regulator
MKVVIVPESSPVAKKVEAYLDERHVDVVMASDPAQAIRSAGETKPCAIVAVDGDAPDTSTPVPTEPNILNCDAAPATVDAATLACELRESGHSTPLLVMTDHTEASRAASVLDNGADDVVTARAELPGVGSRLRALVRRCHAVTGNPRQFGDLKIDVAASQVTLLGKDVKLTQREFAVLEFLSRSDGKFVTREALLDACWPAAVARLFARLQSDPRHRDIVVFHDGRTAERQFATFGSHVFDGPEDEAIQQLVDRYCRGR